ncbi:hypothetical protein [Novosphingobium panipatense]|uniref:Uncharacterized protein n=1 Tax=Novosphingobium panipatense TaxID=428991 RepID=A0ABY1QKH5_9SPHN|nr:hypothetical protein [Novosphingobium panipatense]SMP74111.1 hypothetical protein SAMN06296065_1072 [Novosphingobium panipatense]
MATKTPNAAPKAAPAADSAAKDALDALVAAVSVLPSQTVIVGDYRVVTNGSGELVEVKRR